MSEMVAMPIVKIGDLVLDNVISYSWGYERPSRGVGGVFLSTPIDLNLTIVIEGEKPIELQMYILTHRIIDNVILEIKNFVTMYFGMVIITRISSNYSCDKPRHNIFMKALRYRIMFDKEELARMQLMDKINSGEIYIGFKTRRNRI